MFASQTTETIPIPFDPPHTVTVRRLTGREYETAQAKHLQSLFSGESARGWSSKFQRTLKAGITATDAEALALVHDPLNGFDRMALAKAGLVAWTYPEKVTRIDDVDDEGLEFIALAVLRVTKPALFETAEEREAAQVKETAPAI